MSSTGVLQTHGVGVVVVVVGGYLRGGAMCGGRGYVRVEGVCVEGGGMCVGGYLWGLGLVTVAVFS